ncbi:DUF6215 domain-containing protein [Kitasatospora sp. NPDC005751]|uniref:DUF6215 domain-containing protein n=1 Tax=Kitasatospora sp. NPDC005751 TaxID=3157064 RepID=UPI0033C5C9F7
MATVKPGRNTAATVTAVALAAVGIGGGAWALVAPRTERAEPPAACAAPRPTDPAGYAVLCAALNRPDLPALLGTPQDRVSTAGPAPFGLGKDAMVEVRLGVSAVALTDSSTTVEDIADMPRFLPRPATVLGHPAMTYYTDAMSLGFGTDGKATTGVGSPVRNLVVAQGPGAPGGRAFEVAVFRHDGRPVDDALLYRVAEAVMPTLPGWVTAPSEPSGH